MHNQQPRGPRFMASSPALVPSQRSSQTPTKQDDVPHLRSPFANAGRSDKVPHKNRLAAVGAETHAVERGVVGGVAAVVHAVRLGGRHVLEEVHVGAGNNTGVA